MRIHLLAFGMLRELLGNATGALELPGGATVEELLERCRSLAPESGGLWSSVAVAVNQEYVQAGHRLAEGDEVALLPPVSGGVVERPEVRIVQERILAQEVVSRLESPEDGAVVIFDGIVRNHSRGRRTLYLEYEAYETMALQQMDLLATGAMASYPIRNLAMVHRVGRIEIGESSVLIAVFSAHRAAAFDACRWLIDTLKQTVPIWKKEYFEDGAVWAQGDPFPEALTPGGGSQKAHTAVAKKRQATANSKAAVSRGRGR